MVLEDNLLQNPVLRSKNYRSGSGSYIILSFDFNDQITIMLFEDKGPLWACLTSFVRPERLREGV